MEEAAHLVDSVINIQKCNLPHKIQFFQFPRLLNKYIAFFTGGFKVQELVYRDIPIRSNNYGITYIPTTELFPILLPRTASVVESVYPLFSYNGETKYDLKYTIDPEDNPNVLVK